jgi:hypothetical protein
VKRPPTYTPRCSCVLLGMPDSAEARPPALSALKLLKLLGDEKRDLFLPAVVEQLCTAAPAAVVTGALHDAFGLDFAGDGEPAALLHATKLLLCRVASVGAAAEDATLQPDLMAAGLAEAAATWVCEAAEAAVRPVATELRQAQAHAAIGLSHDRLHEFDWSLYHVLGSSTISTVQAPLVQLQLQIAKVSESALPPPATATIGHAAGCGWRAGLASSRDLPLPPHLPIGASAARTRPPCSPQHFRDRLTQAGPDGELVNEAIELTPSDLDAALGALGAASKALAKLPQPSDSKK